MSGKPPGFQWRRDNNISMHRERPKTNGNADRIMKPQLAAVLLNSTVENAFLAGATKSVNYILQTIDELDNNALISGLIKARIWQSTPSPPDLAQRSVWLVSCNWQDVAGFSSWRPFRALAASARYFKGQWGHQNENKKRQTDRIIDIDEYIVIEENQWLVDLTIKDYKNILWLLE